MKYILITILLATGMDSLIIFDFNTKSKIQNWKIVDDRVMGGESLGTFTLSPEGNGIFKGYVVAVCFFSLLNWFYPYEKWSMSTTSAFSFNVVKRGSDLLIKEFPNYEDIINTKEKIEKI